VNYCVDCVHYRRSAEAHYSRCAHPTLGVTETNPVTGQTEKRFCREVRRSRYGNDPLIGCLGFQPQKSVIAVVRDKLLRMSGLGGQTTEIPQPPIQYVEVDDNDYIDEEE
jgi:hypothetical protein